ncbi:MAG: hypothetical protein HY647_10035 [Acidobacteria bacterium]|nr:hypothetical protein [Acidobacteriota bacterium]
MRAFASAVILAYAAVLVLSGLAGWRLYGRRLSFTTGLASAALLAIAYNFSFTSPRAGYAMATAVSLAMAVGHTRRFRKTKQIFPPGIMMLLSGVAAALLAITTMMAW